MPPCGDPEEQGAPSTTGSLPLTLPVFQHHCTCSSTSAPISETTPICAARTTEPPKLTTKIHKTWTLRL